VSTYQGPNRRRRRNLFSRALRQLGHDPGPEDRWHHIWRDFVPLAALMIAAFAVLGVERKVDQATVNATVAKRLAQTQGEGRRVALGVTCGALRGVEDAGRLVLTQRLPGTRGLYPQSSPRERVRMAQIARAYNQVITDRIVEEAGVAGERVIEPNGSVNCARLRDLARAPSPTP
jgi:hypothetical protein